MKSGNLKFLEPSGPLQACNGDCFTFIRMNPCESFKFNCWSFLQSLEIMSHPSGKISIRYPITEELLRGIFRYKTEEVTGVGLYEVCAPSDIIMVIK